MNGDIVVCIGQMAIGVGKALRKMLLDSPILTNGYAMQFLFVDEYGVDDSHPHSANMFHRLETNVYTWERGYNSGYSGVLDKIYILLENCDNPTSVLLVYGADDTLGSGLCCFLSEYIANNIPGLTLTNIGLLPIVSAGGLATYNAVMSSYASGIYADSRFLRKLVDSEYILRSAGVYENHTAGYDFLNAAVAADLSAMLLDPGRCALLCGHPGTTVDVRSSLWSLAFDSVSAKHSSSSLSVSSSSKSHGGGGGGGGRRGVRNSPSYSSSDIDKTLRLMTMNIHSLHVSNYPPFHMPHAATAAVPMSSSPMIYDARFTFVTPRSNAPLNHGTGRSYGLVPTMREQYADIVALWEQPVTTAHPLYSKHRLEYGRHSQSASSGGTSGARAMSMLQGCTPGVFWPNHIPQNDVCEGKVTYHSDSVGSRPAVQTTDGSSKQGGRIYNIASMSFTSPYAKRILKGDIVQRAEKCREVGAYSAFSHDSHQDIDLALCELKEWLAD